MLFFQNILMDFHLHGIQLQLCSNSTTMYFLVALNAIEVNWLPVTHVFANLYYVFAYHMVVLSALYYVQ